MHRHGHVPDGEGEAVEHKGGHEKEDRGHHRLLLRLGDGGEEQFDAQRGQQEQHSVREQQQRAAPEGNAKQDQGNHRDQDKIEQTDQGKGVT